MFIRVKHNGHYDYLQLVDSQRLEGKVRQSVIGTLGRRDVLENSQTLAGLMASLGKFTRHAAVLADHRSGKSEILSTRSLGPVLVFARLWEQLGLPAVLAEALQERKFGFAVERAIFLTHLRQYNFVTSLSVCTYEFRNRLWHDTSSSAPDDAYSCLRYEP